MYLSEQIFIQDNPPEKMLLLLVFRKLNSPLSTVCCAYLTLHLPG